MAGGFHTGHAGALPAPRPATVPVVQVQPRVPLTDAYLEAWARLDAVEFVRSWTGGTIDQGEHTRHTGNRLVEVPHAGHVVMHWTPTPQLANLSGNVHGGYIALVCDEAAGVAAATTGHKFVPMLTLDLDVTFLRPARVGAVHVVHGEVLHPGRQRAVSEARVLTPEGKLCATARGSFVPNNAFVEMLRTARS